MVHSAFYNEYNICALRKSNETANVFNYIVVSSARHTSTENAALSET